MASKTGLSVQGLDGATAITGLMAAVQATQAGADWVGGLREDDPRSGAIVSNARILKYLADGGREIRPNSEDQKEAANLVANELVKQMNMVGRTVTTTNKRTNITKTITLTSEKQARAGLTEGLKKAAKHLAAQMYDRVKSGTNADGTRKPVTAPYAKWRHTTFGVADSTSIIFIASRQLGEALQKGTVKVRFKSAGLGKALAALK